MFGLFAKKIQCFHCDHIVKEKESIYRRGFRFCRQGCVEAFLVDSPLRPHGGDSASWHSQAKLELELAFGELAAIVTISGGEYRGSANVGGNVLGAVQAIQAMEGVTDAYARYNSHVLQALPYLYALGLDDRCAELETQDLDALYDLTAMGAGSMQMRKVRNLVEPVVPVVEMALSAVSSPSP
jgi:hypothetical protein